MDTGRGPPAGRGRDDREPREWVRPVRRDPTDPRGQRAQRERTDPRGQRTTSAAPPRMLPAIPTLVIGTAVVVLAFVLGRATSGGGDEASVTVATVASSTTTTTRVIKHTVARGESLLGIASKYGVSVADLAAVNGITNQNRVFVGQVLTIPPTTLGIGATTTTTTTTTKGK